MLKTEGLYKFFDTSAAVSDVTLEIESGRIYGLLGENGAGKTTLLRLLGGIYKADRGTVKFEIDGGFQTVFDNPAAKSRIGYVADSNSFFPQYKIKELLNFYAGIYKNFSFEVFKAQNAVFGLDMNKRVYQLSKGMKMRLAFMLALALRPSLLILDEPTDGLDVLAKKELFAAIAEESEKNNTAVLISTHQINELEQLCDSLFILKKGELLAETDVAELRKCYKKYQVIFKDRQDKIPVTKELLSRTNIGSIHTIIARDMNGGYRKSLVAKQPEILEEVPLSLEELFICSVKGEVSANA